MVGDYEVVPSKAAAVGLDFSERFLAAAGNMVYVMIGIETKINRFVVVTNWKIKFGLFFHSMNISISKQNFFLKHFC